VAGTIRAAALIGACTIAADQASKAAVQLLPATGILHPLVNPEFTLGVASASRPVMLILMGLGIAAAAVTGLRASAGGVVPAAAVGLLVAGAASNLLDRVLLDAVRDFLVIGTIVANLADLAVLAGLIGCAWSLLNRRRRAQLGGQSRRTTNPASANCVVGRGKWPTLVELFGSHRAVADGRRPRSKHAGGSSPTTGSAR